MQKILEITRTKTVNSEKVVKNIDLKLQKILEIVKPNTVNTEKIVKYWSNICKYQKILRCCQGNSQSSRHEFRKY